MSSVNDSSISAVLLVLLVLMIKYTFRYNTVLREVIEILKTFILNIKDTVPISPKSSIKFVRKGTKVPRKRTPPVGILHHASDWILLADLNKTYCFPVHIAFTQLRPDITIFSNNLRKVIFIVKKYGILAWD